VFTEIDLARSFPFQFNTAVVQNFPLVMIDGVYFDDR
jgi:hypothetical protein